MLRILKIAKKAREDGYNYIGFNLSKEPGKIKALVEFTEKHNLFTDRGLDKSGLLDLCNRNCYIGLDLRDMYNEVDFTRLVWRSGSKMNGTSTIKVVDFKDLIYMGFWL